MEIKLNNLKLHTDLSTVDPLVLARVLMKVKNLAKAAIATLCWKA